MLKSGERQFTCNKCEYAASSPRPTRHIGLANRAEGASAHSPTQPAATTAAATLSTPSKSLTQAADLKQVPLRSLLILALERISFLTDQVSQMEEENERIRREAAAKADAHAAAVKSLWQEVHLLRSELTRQCTTSTSFPTLVAPTSRPVWPAQPVAPSYAGAVASPNSSICASPPSNKLSPLPALSPSACGPMWPVQPRPPGTAASDTPSQSSTTGESPPLLQTPGTRRTTKERSLVFFGLAISTALSAASQHQPKALVSKLAP